MAVANGSDILVFVGGKKVGHSSTHTITFSADASEYASKDSGTWSDKISGKKSWEISVEALYDISDETDLTKNGFDDLFTAYKAGTVVTISSGFIAADSLDATKKHFTGSAIITSMELNAPHAEAVTYSVSLSGTGEPMYE